MIIQELSKKQSQVLQFIQKYYQKYGKSPTLPEIATDLNVSSKGTVTEHLGALEKKGFIKRIPGTYRGIVLTDEDTASVEIPLKGYVAAGSPITAVEGFETVKVPKRFVSNANKRYFALEVQGDSMIEDGIYNGEVIIVEQRNTANNGDLVVARDEDGGVTLKYFYKEHNRVRLEPRNGQYQPLYLENCQIIGLLRGITNKQVVFENSY